MEFIFERFKTEARYFALYLRQNLMNLFMKYQRNLKVFVWINLTGKSRYFLQIYRLY
jgi:hypothetical protein